MILAKGCGFCNPRLLSLLPPLLWFDEQWHSPSFEQIWISFTQGCIMPRVLETFFLIKWYFSTFEFSFFWKSCCPSFEQTWIFTQGCFVPTLIEIGPVVPDKKTKMWKDEHNDNKDNNEVQHRQLTDQKSSFEASTQVS